MKTIFLLSLCIFIPAVVGAQEKPAAEAGWITLFDGTSLKGWHVSAKSGHSGTSKNTSGGKWEVKDGAIIGSQDVPGNGGLILTDEQFGDFEVIVEMNNDFGPDSGLFLRSTEDGKAWQAMIDYHAGGNLMGIYGEGLGGNPHVRNYNFKKTPDEIEEKKTGEPPTALAVKPESWKFFWRHGQWNEFRARIEGNPPHVTTWINGVQIMEWQEKEVRHPNKGAIALQVHGGGDFTKQFVRYRNVKVRKLGKETAQAAVLPAGPIVINVNSDGDVLVNQALVARAELEVNLQLIASVNKEQAIVILGDERANYAQIFTVLDVARKAGLNKISFAAQKPVK